MGKPLNGRFVTRGVHVRAPSYAKESPACPDYAAFVTGEVGRLRAPGSHRTPNDTALDKRLVAEEKPAPEPC